MFVIQIMELIGTLPTDRVGKSLSIFLFCCIHLYLILKWSENLLKSVSGCKDALRRLLSAKS